MYEVLIMVSVRNIRHIHKPKQISIRIIGVFVHICLLYTSILNYFDVIIMLMRISGSIVNAHISKAAYHI